MINKRAAIKLMVEYGDFIIDYMYGRLEPVVCTTDFKNKYIKNIRRNKRFNLKGCILVFNWTDNEFQAIPTSDIFKVTPLSSILNNKGKDDGQQKIDQKCNTNRRF